MVKMEQLVWALLLVCMCILSNEKIEAQSFGERLKQGVRNIQNNARMYNAQRQIYQNVPRMQQITLNCNSKEEAEALAAYLEKNLNQPGKRAKIKVSKKKCYVTSTYTANELKQWVEKYQASLVQQTELATNKSTSDKDQNLKSSEKTAAPPKDNTVTLIVSGEAPTKDEATRIALRSAIEQAFGTFVSANTEVLNDELVKDEIVTISTGNIQSYKELSCIDTENGNKNVSLQAVVSIDKLVNYAQSKGMTAELAGATFAMNMKMKELNRNNEAEAMKNLVKQLEEIVESGLFDFELIANDPKLVKENQYQVSLDINILANQNTLLFYQTFYKTIHKLSISESEYQELKKIGIHTYNYEDLLGEGSYYITRNKLSVYNQYIWYLIGKGYCSFAIIDNIGNNFMPFEILGNLYDTIYDAIYRENKNTDSLIQRSVLVGGEYSIFSGFKNGEPIIMHNTTKQAYCWGLKNKQGKSTSCHFAKMGHVIYSSPEMASLISFCNRYYKPNYNLQVGDLMFSWRININYSLDEIYKLSSFKVEPAKVEMENDINLKNK